MTQTTDEWFNQMEQVLFRLGTQAALNKAVTEKDLRVYLEALEAFSRKAKERRMAWADSLLESVRELCKKLDAGCQPEHALVKVMHLIVESSRQLFNTREATEKPRKPAKGEGPLQETGAGVSGDEAEV